MQSITAYKSKGIRTPIFGNPTRHNTPPNFLKDYLALDGGWRTKFLRLRLKAAIGLALTRKETTMKLKVMPTIFALALLLVAGFVSLSLSPGVASASASSPRKGHLHVTKECSAYNGQAGSFCTFTSSNLPAIKVGSKVYYDQAAGTPTGLLDSNVVLDAGDGNRAFGRCTLDLSTYRGLCTFSDGTGEFNGFHARLDVSPLGWPDFIWDGTYSFTKEPGDDR